MEAASAFQNLIKSGRCRELADPVGQINGYASAQFSAVDSFRSSESEPRCRTRSISCSTSMMSWLPPGNLRRQSVWTLHPRRIPPDPLKGGSGRNIELVRAARHHGSVRFEQG